MRVALVCLVACLAVPSTAQDRPLPDFQTFMQEARKRLQPDEARQSGYMYVETRREQKLDPSGQATRETVNVFESYPGLPGEPRWERMIAKEGVKVTPAELARQDRERQEKVMEYVRKRDRDPEKVRAQEARKRAEEQRELDEAVDDALRIYEMRMLGRENIRGHDTIVISFTPRPKAVARTRYGKILRHFAGKAWVSEREYRARAARGRGAGHGLVRAGPPCARAQGVARHVRTSQSERRGVAAGERHLHGQRPCVSGAADARRRCVGVCGLSQIHGRYRYARRPAKVKRDRLASTDRCG